MGAAFDAAPGDARDDVAAAQLAPAKGVVIGFVGMELGRPSAPAANRLYGIDRRRENLAVVTIGAGQDNRERSAAPVHHDVALGAWLATVGRVRTDRGAPFLAATDEESIDARDQSISPENARRSSMWQWISSQRPVSCQALSLRQQVMPEHPTTSYGRRSHGIAV